MTTFMTNSPLGLLIFPEWIMGIMYFIGALCVISIKAMPINIRISLSIPLFIIGSFYQIIWFVPFDPLSRTALIRYGSAILIAVIIINYIVYRYAQRNKIL